MLSKADIKLLQGLQTKKERKTHRLFIAEGEKIVEELLEHKFPVKKLYAVEDWNVTTNIPVIRITHEELKKISSLSTPNKVLALCDQLKDESIDVIEGEWVFALDDLQDPGNLGTIIRIADWFGIKTLVCSTNSVDLYNPKVIQSTMGSFIGLNVIYTDLEDFLNKQVERGIPVYGTTLQGQSVFKTSLIPGIIVFGNESSGISSKIRSVLTKEILIPPSGSPVADSLNVAVSAAALAAIIHSW